MSLEETYIQYGVPNNWAHNYELIGIPASTFKTTSKKNLISRYKIPEGQIKFVKNCLVRQPIDNSVVQKLLENNQFVCCLCKGKKSDAFIIHHIIEYSLKKDNKYNNLAVVCPNDHDLVHRPGNKAIAILTNQITEKQIRESKKNWELQVKKENKAAALNKPIRGKIKDWQKETLYKELQSFTESDKGFFFGRKIEIEELIIKIHKYNIVGLFGESGTGKTSLVNAGLIPNFKKEGFVTVSIRCLDEPIKRIREELLKTLKEKRVSTLLIEELAATDTFSHLIIKLKSIVEKENLNFIIIIDQFEELFTRAREVERENLSKGIVESLLLTSLKGKVYFLLSLREDYIGELWDWAHLYNLEDAWIHQYRIKRLTQEKAFEAIVQPLHKIGIKTDSKFVLQLISELKNIGDGLIYPPYLQIVCTELFEEYKIKNSSSKPLIEFDQNLYNGINTAETIIADYLSESMLKGLTEEEKTYAQNILDLLTGSEGLRTFLTIEDISRYLTITSPNAQHVIEHLIKKKIVHPVVGDDKVTGYELVHDFLSKKFFDKLGTEAKRAKTIIDIFRKSFREWKSHEVLASKDRLEILFPNTQQLVLNDEEWTFLIKSSFSVYLYYENKWIDQIEKERLSSICMNLLQDKNERIVEHSISSLGKIGGDKITATLIRLIESPKTTDSIKEVAIRQFMFDITDSNILNPLKDIIKNHKNSKLRKNAIYAFAQNLNRLLKSNMNIVNKEIEIVFDALNDPKTEVRRQAADVLGYTLIHEKSTKTLILSLEKEVSISSRKVIVASLSSLLQRNLGGNKILPILKKVSKDEDEDYRVREEAKRGIPNN
jgi:ABC-type dipeptide/oligopeptide/nickel transport system ATPase component